MGDILLKIRCIASWQHFLGLNPKEQSLKWYSEIGSIVILWISCITLSIIVGIPRGRFFPFGFGIYTRLMGLGILSLFTFLRRLERNLSASSLGFGVATPSTPAVCFPLLVRVTLSIATILTALEHLDNR